MIEAEFTVYGRNYWELDKFAGEVLESLVGDLVDQRADYDIRATPALEAYGLSEPVLWRGEVRARVDGIPEARDYNRRSR